MVEVNATSSAVALTTALRSGAVAARELLETYLERIERLDRDSVNAVVTLDADRARQAASAADDARARGESLGPLHDQIRLRAPCGATTHVVFEPDGNFVAYRADNTPTWSANIRRKGGERLVVQNDGNLVIYSATHAVWSSGTHV